MIEKEYYRLDELEKRFNLSFSDVLYLVENSKLELIFRLDKKEYIIGGWQEEKGFVGFAKASYQGFVRISKNNQVALLSEKEVNCEQFWLTEKEKIQNWITEYPFQLAFPNTFLYMWQPKELHEIEWQSIPAKLLPIEKEYVYRTLINGMDKAFKMIIPSYEKPEKNVKELDENLPKVQLDSQFIDLKLADACLLHNDLVKVGVTQPISPTDIVSSNNLALSVTTNKNHSDDFNELLFRLVEAEPEHTAKLYWRSLENELDDLEEYRVFDKYNLLTEITVSHIKWKDRNGKPRLPISYNAFANRVSKVKKKLFNKNTN